KKEMSVNFCTSCKVVLANEEVINGTCERCHSEVIRAQKSQWMLKITEYAQRLLDDLDEVDYIERVKTQQRNWIGRSTGAEVKFATSAGDELLIYTTRPDTLFGATYMVISPEHPYIEKWSDRLTNIDAIHAYQKEAAKKSDFERSEVAKEKTGVKLEGVTAINPVNGREIPIFVSDYVLMSYGTGAIMAVPAHDERDYDFAKAFDLPIIEVVAGGDVSKEAYVDIANGVMINSGFLDGMKVQDAIKTIIEWLHEKKLGEPKVNFKLRDWVFSRQRYWGEPIPIVKCEKCGYVAIPESELPLKLPEVESYEQTDTGESPLSLMTDWVNTTCPHCGGPAKRETDTMPQWAGSSWYFLRYMDPHNREALAGKDALNYWNCVDWYNGGMEHTTLHLLYSRFWHKFLYDIGVVPTKEPYMKRTSHGMILGADGEKMSKSRGNVVNPDEIIDEYGADTMRLYEMFMGDFEKAAPWSNQSIRGCKRFLDRVFGLYDILTDEEGYSPKMESAMHKAIKKVSNDIEILKFNTAIATLMSLLNDIYAEKKITRGELATFITLLNPFAPHITEELWSMAGFKGMIAEQKWPEFDEKKTVDESIEIAVQVNGKLRGTIKLPMDSSQEEALALAYENESVKTAVEGKKIVKEIYVKNKIVNIVAK
ncbi:MAG: leucine--tRNA ligase, partial [Clostridia bacterium]|nr:leucine--tRNA ligase [Clostridia bacterium]